MADTGSMKFLVLTDLHGKESAMDWINPLIEREGIGCVLFLGDAVQLPCEVEESVRMISLIKAPRILALPGNIDDPSLPENLGDAAEDMHGVGKEVGGKYIAGCGGSNPTIFDTPCEFPEEEIYDFLDPVSKEGMVLMVHCPAYGHRDHIPNGMSVGSKSVLEIVEKYHPRIVFSGHIHEDLGSEECDGTLFVNPGPAMDGRCAIFDSEDMSVRILGPTD